VKTIANAFITFSSVLLIAGAAAAQPSSDVAPDNSRSNKSDSTNRSTTADDQTNQHADIDLTKRIRQSLTADKGLSTYAHNVKIVSINGHVTLNGVVQTTDEKASVEAKAEAVAGAANVTNQLKVKAGN